LVALSGATAFIRGLQRITDVDPGWSADGVLAARLNLIGPQYTQAPARRTLLDTVRDRAAELPGITAAAVSSSSVPAFPYGTSTTFAVEGRKDTVLAY